MSEFKFDYVEGWLRKKKSYSSMSIISNFVKRWFILDTKRGIFGYSNGKTKNPRVVHPVRDIISFDPPRDEQYDEFVVHTTSKSYHLVAYDKDDLQKWVSSFEVLMKIRLKHVLRDVKKPRKSKKKKNVKDSQQEKEADGINIDEICKQNGPMETMKLDPPSPAKVEPANSVNVYTQLRLFAASFANKSSQLQRFKTEKANTTGYNSQQDSYDSGSCDSWNVKANDSVPVASNFKTQKNIAEIAADSSFEEDWDEKEDYASISKIADKAPVLESKPEAIKEPAVTVSPRKSKAKGNKSNRSYKRSKTTMRRAAKKQNKMSHFARKAIAA